MLDTNKLCLQFAMKFEVLQDIAPHVMSFTRCAEQNTEQCAGFSDSVGLRGRLLRKIEALKAEESGSETPDEFLCPITRELMKEPVIAAGQTTNAQNIYLSVSFTVTSFTTMLYVRVYIRCNNVSLLHRRIFLRARVHRELDQRQEQNQSHDKPASTDHTPHPQQIPEDGDSTVEIQQLKIASFQNRTKQVLHH